MKSVTRSPGSATIDIDFRHPLPRPMCLCSRQRLILDYCRGKSVLHLGCVESGNVRASFDSGALLHLQLLENAKRVVGIDNDIGGIQFLTEKGIPNLLCADLERLDWRDISDSVEVVVAGEIIEHLNNPGLVLSNIAEWLSRSNGILIVTVPNAYSLRHIISVVVQNTELVMSDHNFWFSYATLSSLLRRHRLNALKWYTYSDTDRMQGTMKRLVKTCIAATVFRIWPFLAEGIIVVAEGTVNRTRGRSEGAV